MTLIRFRELAAYPGRRRLERSLRDGERLRLTRGLYGPADATDDDRLRALFLRLPDGSMLGFHTAARRHGFGTLRSERVHVIVPPGAAKPRIQGVVAHESVLPEPAPVLLGGVPCAPAARCAVDLARTVRRMDALPVLDAALRAAACDEHALRTEVERHCGLRGVRQARELATLADGRSECRQESQLRLVIVDGGLPAPEPQIKVADEYGEVRYRIDLGYPDRRLGLEYDGVSHTYHDRVRQDRTRMNWLAMRGWSLRYFTDRDLYRWPAGIVATVRRALDA